MKALILILSLAVVDCKLIWKPLNKFEEFFSEAKLSAKDAIESVEKIMSNRTADSFNFIRTMENISMVKAQLDDVSNNLDCKTKFWNLKNNFRKLYNRMEVPILQRAVEIGQRLSGISSTVLYYQNIADNKYWSCRLSKGDNCSTVVEQWLEQKMLSLSCEIVPCESHVVRKRQLNWFRSEDPYNTPCETFACGDSECIPNSYVCDGEDDCEDNSDEADCPNNCDLKYGRYLCGNSKCIDFSSTCNGIDNCGDNSDEINCYKEMPYTPNNCNIKLGTYLCENKKCIQVSSVCDGKDDCGDESDEYDCSEVKLYAPNNCSLDLGTYLCGNKKCIAISSVCDGRDDCGDGTDEGGNCTGSCQEDCHPRGVCLRTPRSQDCVTGCPEGSFETASGCQRSIEPESSALSQLVLDMERLISRHSAAYLLLKTRTLSEMVLFSFMTDCRNYKNAMLDKITKIKPITSNIKPTTI